MLLYALFLKKHVIQLALYLQDIEQYLSGESRKEGEVINVRLENIKLKNKLKKKEHQLKSKVSQ